MHHKLSFSNEAKEQLERLESDQKKLKKVRKTLGFLEVNPKMQGLNVHRFKSLKGPDGEEMWEAYVENNTPSAYRVLFYYGPTRGEITVVTITPHPR